MLKVVIGFDLFTIVDIKSPIAPNRKFSNSVYRERIKNALMLNGPFLTSSMLINPARAVIKFKRKTFM